MVDYFYGRIIGISCKHKVRAYLCDPVIQNGSHTHFSFFPFSAMLSHSQITSFSNGSGKDDSRRRLRPKPTPLPHGQRKHAIQLDQTAERSPAGKGRLFNPCARDGETSLKREFNFAAGTRPTLLQRARYHQEAHRRLP